VAFYFWRKLNLFKLGHRPILNPLATAGGFGDFGEIQTVMIPYIILCESKDYVYIR